MVTRRLGGAGSEPCERGRESGGAQRAFSLAAAARCSFALWAKFEGEVSSCVRGWDAGRESQ